MRVLFAMFPGAPTRTRSIPCTEYCTTDLEDEMSSKQQCYSNQVLSLILIGFHVFSDHGLRRMRYEIRTEPSECKLITLN
jgi:hypothetical protein